MEERHKPPHAWLSHPYTESIYGWSRSRPTLINNYINLSLCPPLMTGVSCVIETVPSFPFLRSSPCGRVTPWAFAPLTQSEFPKSPGLMYNEQVCSSNLIPVGMFYLEYLLQLTLVCVWERERGLCWFSRSKSHLRRRWLTNGLLLPLNLYAIVGNGVGRQASRIKRKWVIFDDSIILLKYGRASCINKSNLLERALGWSKRNAEFSRWSALIMVLNDICRDLCMKITLKIKLGFDTLTWNIFQLNLLNEHFKEQHEHYSKWK